MDTLTKCSFRAFLLAMSLLLLGSPAHAQFDVGDLVGTIHDQSGAAVPGATITVTNNATNITATATSNSNGDYEVPSLHAGVYTISAKATNYAEALAKNITISVGNRQRIDLELKVGETQTSVEVSDVALQLETESSQRGQTITQYQTEAFPLVSRNYSDLLALVTGSRQAPTAAATSSINSLVRARGPTTSTASAACSTTSCSTAWTTTPTARATRVSTTRSSPSRRTRSRSGTW